VASGKLIIPLAEPSLGDTGLPISGATLTVNIAGGSTLASLFADAALATPITNPQTANAAGRFFAQSTEIWADASQAYDCILAYPSTGQSFTFLNVYLVGAGSNVSGFAPLNSPNFTGVPTAPTPALNDNSTKIATTAFVKGQNYATLNSPAFTGVPTAPTAAAGTNTTQLATTAFVTAAFANSLGTSGYQKLAGGLIMQWGSNAFTSSSSSVNTFNVTLPIAFPTAGLWGMGAAGASPTFTGIMPSFGVSILSTTQIQVTWHATAGGQSLGVNWLALGN
jgi:hypothetical protein